MSFVLWRGGRLLGPVVEFEYDHEFTVGNGVGRLDAEDLPLDLEGSSQMRARHGAQTIVTQFPHPAVDFDAIPKRATSGRESVLTPAKIMDAEMAAPMRDDFVLTLHDESGALIEVDMISLQHIKWPAGFAQ